MVTGNEKFIVDGKDLEFGILDLWKYKYSNIFNMQEVIAEFIVEKALGLTKSQNTDYWTLFDILYRNYRIEVKETGYYHSWNEDGKISQVRNFGISKANSSYEEQETENKFERQNDIYVFCLNTGTTKETSNPMNLNNWEFYIVPTSIINEECGNNKHISLGKVRKLAKQIKYTEIKETIDSIIEQNGSNKEIESYDNVNNTLDMEISKIKSEEWKNIFLDKLAGFNYTDIGKKYNLSRERIRVIINKIIDEMELVKEDSYRNIFEEYFIDKELFCEIFSEKIEVYGYLELKYQKGYSNIEELYYSNRLNVKQNEKLKAYIDNQDNKVSNENWYIEFNNFLNKNSLTAKKVSELTGLSKATIDSYKQGKRKPTDENKQIIKEKIGFDLSKSIYNKK